MERLDTPTPTADRRWPAWLTPGIFSRVTSTGRFIPEIDGLRTLAIGAVFWQHLQQQLAAIHPGGPDDIGVRMIVNARLGVELFFVISGFILGVPFASAALRGSPPVRPGRYYLRRLTRLEPPYALHLVLIALGLLVAGRPLARIWPHFLASLFYVNNVTFGQWHPDTLNTVTWSLEIEVQFYILAPVFAAVFKLRRAVVRRLAIVSVAIAVFAIRHALELRFGAFPETLLNSLPYFAAGFLVADQYVSSWAERLPRRPGFDLVALGAWIALPAMFLTRIPAPTLTVAAGLWVAVTATLQSNFLRRLLASFWVRTLGGMCYSFYLLHLVLLRMLVPLLHLPILPNTSLGILEATLVFGPLVLIPTAVYFVLVEKPCMKRDWWRRFLPERNPSESALVERGS